MNAERLLADPEQDGWSGSLESRINLSQGNVNRLDFSLGGSMQYWDLYPDGAGYGSRRAPPDAPRFFKDRWVLITNAAFVQVGFNEVVNRGFAHMRFTRMWVPRLGSEFFLQGQYNTRTRLRTRIIGGLGFRADPIREKVLQSWLGSGYMAEYEANDTVKDDLATPDIDETDPHPARVVNHRWTNYGVVQVRLWDSGLVARDTVYAQPRFDNFRDVRVLQSLQIETLVADGLLALGLSFDVQYDSMPPLEVQPVDLYLGSYIRINSG